ncbi:MAG: YcgN family cysteine cluster protein [Paracoccus sp. (in: a-proteobacteria)]
MRPRFWKLPLRDLDSEEWEALCDGCGKCCLNKLEFEDTGELAFTRVACRLLDGQTCCCTRYETRHRHVPECVTLSPEKIREISYWLPVTCAYRLRYEGQELPAWHYLISGDREAIHHAGASVRGWVVSEAEISERDWEDYIIEDLA